MQFLNKLLLVFALLTLAACATPLTKEELVNVKNVAIKNNFPQKPNFTNIGTTMFNNKYDSVDDESYKQVVTNELAMALKNKGYKVIDLSNGTPDSSADLIIEIIPRNVYDMIDTNGYGFYDRSFLSSSVYRKSYVALNLSPIFNGKDKCDSCYGESLTDLPIEDMPDLWSDLDENLKIKFKEILKEDIKNAIGQAFSKTGL